jgi:hypothetical protein
MRWEGFLRGGSGATFLVSTFCKGVDHLAIPHWPPLPGNRSWMILYTVGFLFDRFGILLDHLSVNY